MLCMAVIIVTSHFMQFTFIINQMFNYHLTYMGKMHAFSISEETAKMSCCIVNAGGNFVNVALCREIALSCQYL